MKTKYVLTVCFIILHSSFILCTHAQGTAFTYQGRLNDGANAAGGIFDFCFRLASDSLGSNFVGSPLLTNGIPVSSGLFTVALNFGGGIFTGPNYWLQVGVRTNGGGSYTTLTPLQSLAPTPYALMANSASNLLGTLPGGQISGTILNVSLPASPNFSGTVAATSFSGNGTGLTNVNAATLGGLSSANIWKINGNAGANPTNGAFLGTTDNLPLEFKVNGQRALRIEYATNVEGTSPNMVGGFSGNIISNGFVGAVIGGGGRTGGPNRAGNHFATVVGGLGNTASGYASTAMGAYNAASGQYATAMGFASTASGYASTAMGQNAVALHYGSFVWSDANQGVPFSSTANDQFLIHATGGVGIGLNNPTSPLHVASAGSTPQVQLTQTTGGNFTRLRMNVSGSPSWEMDVSSGATPSISWWNVSQRMALDYNGNLTTSGTVNGTSDRNAKEKFTAVISRAVLDKVAALPISEWNFKNESAIRHIGPMAQDFHAAFGLGTDDKHIATVDADGVALAAIQGLNQKVEDLSGQLKRRDSENTELKLRLEKLEQLMNPKDGGVK